jgi:Arc/MetJ-type ribon-helix-helix transcriptional regulator
MVVLLVFSEERRITPEDHLNTLHALVVLVADTHVVRAALRAAQDHRDELSRQRHQLRTAVTAGQKELKEAKASAEGARDSKKGPKGAEQNADKLASTGTVSGTPQVKAGD